MFGNIRKARKESEIRRKTRALKRDLDTLRADVQHAGRDAGGAAVAKLELESERLMNSFNQLFGSARQQGGQTFKEVEHQIEEEPVGSVLIALGVGAIVGALLAILFSRN